MSRTISGANRRTAPPHTPVTVRRVASDAKTLGVLGLLGLALPVNLIVTTAALVRSALASARTTPTRPSVDSAPGPRTIMISGGKMTKALHLARAFHGAGHRVVMVESSKYRWIGHRFSRAVDAFYTVPDPRSPDYSAALLDVVGAEGVDCYVPVCSPLSSYYDALAKTELAAFCEVLHPDAAMVAALDDKYRFTELARSLGLSVPDSYALTDPAQVVDLDLETKGRPYILKSIAYDPVHRLDLTPLPRLTTAETAAFAHAKPISSVNPWILQELIDGEEFCTHATARDGVIQVYACCPSSAFQVNYAMVDQPLIEQWVQTFVSELGLTGQISLDFMKSTDGQVYAIECNPRTHSAITLFDDPVALAHAYLDDHVEAIKPRPTSRPTYWIYHEVWRLLTEPHRRQRLSTIARGTDAIFDWSDPLPFLLVHHLQIPLLLLRNLRRGQGWVRIDFNIGKLVEAAGD